MQKAIYKIENLINGKIYIGQTIHPEKRWWEHRNRAKTHYDNYPIHLAINKYGLTNFDFSVIEWTEDYDNRERELIIQYNSMTPNGYNVSTGGGNNVMYGEDHPRNTVSNDILYNIIQDLLNNKMSDRDIAKKYQLTDKIIADINHGYSHYQENLEYPLRCKRGLQKLTNEQVEDIMYKLEFTDMSYKDIGKIHGVSKGTIYHINKGLTFIQQNREYPIRRRKCNDS